MGAEGCGRADLATINEDRRGHTPQRTFAAPLGHNVESAASTAARSTLFPSGGKKVERAGQIVLRSTLFPGQAPVVPTGTRSDRPDGLSSRGSPPSRPTRLWRTEYPKYTTKPISIHTPNRIQVAVGRFSIRYTDASTDRIGTTGTPRHAERTVEVGPGAPQHDHADRDQHEREQGADVDQLGELLSGKTNGERGDDEARDDRRAVGRSEALRHRENTGGSSRSRLIAKNTRLWPSISTIITVVSPTSAPSDDRRDRVWPTDRNAVASGASTLMWLYLTIPVTTSDTATYSSVQIASDSEDADRHVALWLLGLLGGGRDDVEADEREEHQRGAGEDPGRLRTHRGRPEVLSSEGAARTTAGRRL